MYIQGPKSRIQVDVHDNRSMWASPSTSTLSPISPDSGDFCFGFFLDSYHVPWLRPLNRQWTLCPSGELPHSASLTSPALGIDASLAVRCCPMWQRVFPNYPKGIPTIVTWIPHRREVIIEWWFGSSVLRRHWCAPPCWRHLDTVVSRSFWRPRLCSQRFCSRTLRLSSPKGHLPCFPH